MPPPLVSPLRKANHFYLSQGHRNSKTSRFRPISRDGLSSNRQILQPTKHNHHQTQQQGQAFDIRKWDPQLALTRPNSSSLSSADASFAISLRLSPIARFIIDAFRRNKDRWGQPVVAELNKLRRVPPNLVAEVVKVQNDPALASKFFHWASKQKGYKHNFASYNAYAYCLNRHNQFRAADQIPELMESQGKHPTEKQFEILIRMHSDANRGLRIFFVYQKMKKYGVKPRVFLYNRIMDALVKAGNLDLALSVYDDFRNHGLIEESVTFMILIKGLCKAGRVEEMLELLNRMRSNLCKPDVFAYTAMVKVLVPGGNLDGCLRIWEEMKIDRVEPDVMAYATLIIGLCNGGRVEEGYKLFKEMKEKGHLVDRAIYGSLIESFVTDRKIRCACDLLKDLVDSGYRADLGIYNCLIEGMCNVNQVEKAYKVFQITIHEGLEPDFVTVRPLLVAYAKAKRLQDFCKLLRQLEKLAFVVTDEILKFFSFMITKEGTTIALEVFEYLKEHDYCSVEMYNILIEALHRTGDVKKALSLFEEMKGSRFEPNSSSFSVAIPCHVDVGEIQDACSCYNKIIEISSVPSIPAYTSLAKGLGKIGEIDAAMMLVRDCLAKVTSGPMEFKYSLTVRHACKSNDADKIIEVLDEMMEQGCPPDDIIYSAIISGMCQYGTIEEARKVFSILRERKLLSEASTIVYDEFLIEHMKKKTADLVLSGLKFFGLESKLKAKGCNLLTRANNG